MDGYKMVKSTFKSFDGIDLFYRAWIPAEKTNKAIILFHRGHEHSGRLIDLVEHLNLDGFAYFAWDARGNGESPGQRDYAESFAVYAKDADGFAKHITAEYDIDIRETSVIANSVGAVIATAWVHDYAPPIKSLITFTRSVASRFDFISEHPLKNVPKFS